MAYVAGRKGLSSATPNHSFLFRAGFASTAQADGTLPHRAFGQILALLSHRRRKVSQRRRWTPLRLSGKARGAHEQQLSSLVAMRAAALRVGVLRGTLSQARALPSRPLTRHSQAEM